MLRNYLPLLGPTLGTLYDELAVIDESGMAPDSIPRASSHSPGKKNKTTTIVRVLQFCSLCDKSNLKKEKTI